MSDTIYKDSPIISFEILIDGERKRFTIAAIEVMRYSYVHNTVVRTPKLVFLSEDKTVIINENPYTGGMTGIGVSDWNLKESFEREEPFKVITDDPIEAIRIYKELVITEDEARKHDEARYKEIETALKDEFNKTVFTSGLSIEFHFTMFTFRGIVFIENLNYDIMRLVDDSTTRGSGFTKTGRIKNCVISKVREALNVDRKEAIKRIDEVIKFHMEAYKEFSRKRAELYNQN